ncbi:hypothetical protein [Methylobacterium komagatae]
MPTKLKIKMGHIEFEYEGDAPYGTDAVKDLFTHLEALMGAVPAGVFDGPATPVDAAPPINGNISQLAAGNIAAKLKVKSGPELAIAAAAHLQICLGKDSFNRRELLSTMQSAKTFYNQNMRKNLSNALDSLVKMDKLNSLANDEWSLTSSEMNSVRAILDKS